MSRLPGRTPLSELNSLSNADLNTRFTDFASATVAIDADNMRDGACDLPQYDAQQIVRPNGAQTVTIGPPDWNLVSNVVTTPLIAAPSAAPNYSVPVIDPTGTNPSIIDFGASGFTLTLVDLLRVSWALKVNSTWTGTPYDTAGALGQFDVVTPIPTTITVTDAFHGIPFYLEWDVTSNAKVNWVAVPGQTVFNDVFNIPTRGAVGGPIDECPATSVQPAWVSRGVNVDDGRMDDDAVYARGWRTLRGSWIYSPPLGVTVYGIRVVFKPALYHPCNALVSLKNCLAYDDIAGVNHTAYHQSGFLTAIVQRLG